MKFCMCLCDWSCNYLALSFLTNFCELNLSTTETELLWDSVHVYVIYWGCVLKYLHELNCYSFQVKYYIMHWSSHSNEIHIALAVFFYSTLHEYITPPHSQTSIPLFYLHILILCSGVHYISKYECSMHWSYPFTFLPPPPVSCRY